MFGKNIFVERRWGSTKCYPFPEVGHDSNWKIVEHPKFVVNRSQLTFATPLDAEPYTRRMRSHEIGHIKWTPKIMPYIGNEIHTMAVEDCRINKRLADSGVDLSPTIKNKINISDEEFKSRLQIENIHQQALLYVSSLNTGDHEDMVEVLKDARIGSHLPKIDSLYEEHIGSKSYPTSEDTLNMAKALLEYLEEQYEEDLSSIEDSSLEEYFGIKDEDTESIFNGAYEKAAENAEMGPDSEKMPLTDKTAPWGTMKIYEPDRTMNFDATLKVTPSKRASEEGLIPKNMHRLCSDGRLFQQRGKRKPGGSVLIDDSGSMSLRIEEVNGIMEILPASIIATYAGHGAEGQLRIVAKDNKRVPQNHIKVPMGGNIIDGPALHWLAKQEGPRYWVSDGAVTGINDAGSSTLLRAEAYHICKRFNITWVKNVRELLQNEGYVVKEHLIGQYTDLLS